MSKSKSYRKYLAGAATAAVVAASLPAAGVSAASFKDSIPAWAQEAVDYLVEKGAINGYPDGTFGPYDEITRAEAAKIIATTLGLDIDENAKASFADSKNHWATSYIAALQGQKAGVINGYEDGTFRPNDTITRQEMAKMIVEAYGLELNEEADVTFYDNNGWGKDYINVLASLGIVEGVAQGEFDPGADVTRGQTPVFIHRAEVKEARIDVNKDKKPGQKSVLSIEEVEKGRKLTNGERKEYTVTLTNPVSKKPVAGATLNVTFEENLNTNGKPQNNVVVVNDDNSTTVPYQANDGTEKVVEITTDKDGEATFTITGSNAKVTPIVFLDGSNQEWDTKGGIEIKTKDGRFDEDLEFYAKADTVAFEAAEYEITVEGERSNFAAIGEDNGREYNIVAKKEDGTPYRGLINVGIEELEDDDYTNNLTQAYFVESGDADDFEKQNRNNKPTHVDVRTDKDGKATIKLVSDKVNDSATPVVWIDSTYSDNAQDHKLETGEPRSVKVEPTNFQKPHVAKGTDGAKLEVMDLGSDGKGFNLTVLNQSGKPFLPSFGTRDDLDARVSFTISNNGPGAVEVSTSEWFGSVNAEAGNDYSNKDRDRDVFTIQSGGTLTISGDILDFAKWFDNNNYVVKVDSKGGDAEVTVSGSAVVDGALVDEESQSVAVRTEAVTKTISGSEWSVAKVTDVDVDGNEVVLTFNENVSGFEKSDFRLHFDEGAEITPSSVAYDTERTNVDKKIENKLVLTFSEADLDNGDAESISYDGGRGDADVVLVDKYGNVVKDFSKDL